MNQIVSLEGVGVALGGKPVLRNVDFDLGANQAFGISGPNGSGKTTLLRAIASLTRITEGKGTLLGADMSTGEVYGVRSSIAMIGHVPALIGELTLEENLVHAARLSGKGTDRIGRLLEVVGLGGAAKNPARVSSFGTQRRLEVARALLGEPRLLLLDEALSGLDEAAQGLIDALISRVRARGGGVLMVSHDPSHLEGRCQETFRLVDGRVEPTA